VLISVIRRSQVQEEKLTLIQEQRRLGAMSEKTTAVVKMTGRWKHRVYDEKFKLAAAIINRCARKFIWRYRYKRVREAGRLISRFVQSVEEKEHFKRIIWTWRLKMAKVQRFCRKAYCMVSARYRFLSRVWDCTIGLKVSSIHT
jgi:hypothetical protein